MSEELSFRQEAESEQFDSNKKPFLSILPPGSAWVFLFFVFVIGSILVALFTVKVPVKLHGEGIIVSGIESIPVKFDKTNYKVSKLFVKPGDAVSRGKPLFAISQSDLAESMRQIESLNIQMALNEKQQKEIVSKQHKGTELHIASLKQQDSLISSIQQHLSKAQSFEKEAEKHHKAGLSAKWEWQDKQDAVASLLSQLEQAKADKLTFIRQEAEKSATYSSELTDLELRHAQIKQKISAFDDITFTSPCDCTVSQIFVHTDTLSDPGKVALTLSRESENYTAEIFIPSETYRPVEKGSQVLIKPAAYPSLKYGTIIGSIINSYPATVSGLEYPQLFDVHRHYFRLGTSIDTVPASVLLQSGMRFDAHIVVRYQTLVQFIFE